MRSVLASVIVLFGCSSQAPFLSSDVSTRDMSIAVTADGDAARTHVSASLTGPGPPVALLGADRLVLLAGDVEIPMPRGEGGDYAVDLAPGATGLAIRLARAAPDASVDVDVPMPPATAIAVAATSPRAAPLPVTWAPASGPQSTTLALSGACVPAISRILTVDVGGYTLLPADLLGSSLEACEVTVTLTRALVVQSSAAPLQHRYVSVVQVATTTFESTP